VSGAEGEPIRLAPGDRAPAFEVATLAGEMATLDQLLGGRHLVLHFMREFT
jgi:peroxiredoxin